MNLVLIFFILVVALIPHRGQSTKTLTIFCGFGKVDPSQKEVLRIATPIYSDPKKSKETGTFFLSCSVFKKPGLDIYNACELYFYFHPAGAIEKTTGVITASGVSVIANVTNLAQQPLFQQYAITGGTGKYSGARGVMTDNFMTNPGINTFTVHIN